MKVVGIVLPAMTNGLLSLKYSRTNLSNSLIQLSFILFQDSQILVVDLSVRVAPDLLVVAFSLDNLIHVVVSPESLPQLDVQAVLRFVILVNENADGTQELNSIRFAHRFRSKMMDIGLNDDWFRKLDSVLGDFVVDVVVVIHGAKNVGHDHVFDVLKSKVSHQLLLDRSKEASVLL